MQLRSSLLVISLSLSATGCGLLGNASDRRASLTVANHSHWAICSVQVASPSVPRGRRAPEAFESLDSPDWSENLLRSAVIDPGSAYTVPVPAGRWDLRMDDCRGRPLYARRRMLIRGAATIEFRPIRVERPGRFSRRRVAAGPKPTGYSVFK